MREIILLPIIAVLSLVGLIIVTPALLALGAVLAVAERRGLARIGGLHAAGEE